MRGKRAGVLLAIAAGCTVGGGSSSTLSGGVSGSAGDDAATASADDGASTGVEGTDGSASGDAGDPSTAASGGDDDGDASTDHGDDDGDDASSTGGVGTTSGDESSSGGDDDLADGILDVTIIAHDDCTFTTTPASISVPEGTEFTVNWISSGASEVEFDVAKIDQFNAVPIILGMEPATSYHDEVRVWCGDLFTGTFDFSLTSCFDPQYIPVDCSA